jgi:phage baseplate assembly protein gpV
VIIRDQYGTMLPQIGEQVEVDLGFGHVTSGRVIGVYNMDIVRVELPFEALP